MLLFVMILPSLPVVVPVEKKIIPAVGTGAKPLIMQF